MSTTFYEPTGQPEEWVPVTQVDQPVDPVETLEGEVVKEEYAPESPVEYLTRYLGHLIEAIDLDLTEYANLRDQISETEQILEANITTRDNVRAAIAALTAIDNYEEEAA